MKQIFYVKVDYNNSFVEFLVLGYNYVDVMKYVYDSWVPDGEDDNLNGVAIVPLDDDLVYVKAFKGVKLFLDYEMKNEEGKIVSIGTTSHAFLSTEGKPIRMKQEFPELYETLCSLVSQDK